MYWGGGGIDISVKVDRNWKMGCWSCLHKKTGAPDVALTKEFWFTKKCEVNISSLVW